MEPLKEPLQEALNPKLFSVHGALGLDKAEEPLLPDGR